MELNASYAAIEAEFAAALDAAFDRRFLALDGRESCGGEIIFYGLALAGASPRADERHFDLPLASEGEACASEGEACASEGEACASIDELRVVDSGVHASINDLCASAIDPCAWRDVGAPKI